MKLYVFVVIIACAYAADVKEKEEAETDASKDKRQTQGEVIEAYLNYRQARKQEQITPVEENQEDDKTHTASNRVGVEQYHPGQVFSLNVQELLELQPERKAPLPSSSQLQQLYANPQQEHKQGLQGIQPQFYYLDPQTARQVTLQPSRTVIARPASSINGGEASVGAALSVSDNGASSSDSTFDEELLALLGHPGEGRTQSYQANQVQQLRAPTQSVAPQYQEIDRYITKPTKKPTKLHAKIQINPPQATSAPQQYLIETTNVAQQQLKPQQQQQLPQQYRFVQQQRPAQTLRYVPISQGQSIPQAQATPQYVFYNAPESQNQGLKVVAAPKLQAQQPQQAQQQVTYRFVPQYQPEIAVAPKQQFRYVEARPTQAARAEHPRVTASSVDRPIAYLKHFPEPEKTRAVKFYNEGPESLAAVARQPQIIGNQYYLRPMTYRPTEQRLRYEMPQFAYAKESYAEPTKAPQSSIFVNKNVAPKKVIPQPQYVRLDEQAEPTAHKKRPQPHYLRIDEPVEASPAPQPQQPTKVENVDVEQHGQSIEERRAQLPPPKNNKAYTPEEFAALVAAGYSVTPVPVGSIESPQQAQSRSSIETVPAPVATHQRRPFQSRRHQYLPLRSDEAP